MARLLIASFAFAALCAPTPVTSEPTLLHQVSRGQCPSVEPVEGPRICPAVEDLCRSDIQCPSNQRCCSDGCTRRCRPVCSRRCGFGQRCEILATCLAIGCPPPSAQCVPTSPGGPRITCANVRCANGPCRMIGGKPVCGGQQRLQCPRNDLLASITSPIGVETPDSCIEGACPAGQKCCSYGLAKQCVSACSGGCRRNQDCVLSDNFEGPLGGVIGGIGGPFAGQQRSAVCQTRRRLTCATLDCPSDRRCVMISGQPKCVLGGVQVPGGGDKPGTCPIPNVRCFRPEPNMCESDSECQGYSNKCCFNGCSKKCIQVIFRRG